MSNVSISAAVRAPRRTPASASADPSAGIAAAAHLLLPHLERGRRIDAVTLRAAMEHAFGGSDAAGGMEHAFGGSDAAGAWDWKTAYDACEAATVLFIRKFGPVVRARATLPAAELSTLGKIAALLPTHTRRSEESQALQQFSTPIELALRLFAQHLHASPSRVARTARVQRAKRLLDGTSLPMAEIALRAGFRSLRRFNAVFAGVYRQTPTEIRRRRKSAGSGTGATSGQ